MSEAIPSIMAQSWPWCSQIADEKHENQKSTAIFDIWIFFEISFLVRGLQFSVEGDLCVCVWGGGELILLGESALMGVQKNPWTRVVGCAVACPHPHSPTRGNLCNFKRSLCSCTTYYNFSKVYGISSISILNCKLILKLKPQFSWISRGNMKNGLKQSR